MFNTCCILQILLLHLLPDYIVEELLSHDVVKQAVEKIEVEAPLSSILLGNVPLVPVTKEGLVRDVHRRVEVTYLILCEVDALHEFAVCGR